MDHHVSREHLDILSQLLEHRLVELGLGEEPLQPGVLLLELLQPLGVVVRESRPEPLIDNSEVNDRSRNLSWPV